MKNSSVRDNGLVLSGDFEKFFHCSGHILGLLVVEDDAPLCLRVVQFVEAAFIYIGNVSDKRISNKGDAHAVPADIESGHLLV